MTVAFYYCSSIPFLFYFLTQRIIIGNKKYTYRKQVGIKTNNQAEYLALLLGLEKARELGIKNLIVRGDSQLVIRQMQNLYKVKNQSLKQLFQSAKNLEKEFAKVIYEWVPREQNKEADTLANLSLSET